MRDLIFLGVWAVLLPLNFVSAHVGVLLWVWVALLSPNELLYGFMSGVPFNKIVAIVTLGLVFLHKDKKDPYLDTVLWVLLFFAISVTISWANSIVSTADGESLYEKAIKVMVLSLTIASVMTTRHRMHLLVIMITVAYGFIGVEQGIMSIASGGGHKILGSGSVGDNNSVATAMLMIIPLTFYLAKYSAMAVVRMCFWAVLGLCLVTVIMTFSRGGFVGLLVLAAFTIKNTRNKVASFAIVAAAGLLVFTLAPSSWFDRLSTMDDASNDGSFMGRVVAWKISLLIALDHPFFGGGMHAVQQFLVWSNYKESLHRVNFVTTPPPDDIPHAAHSIYFEILGDLGFVGLALFLTVLALTYWNCNRICRLSKGNPSLAWADDLGRMLQISLVVYMVTGAALSMGYFELIYIFIGLISRCRRTVEMTVKARGALDAARLGGEAATLDGDQPGSGTRPSRWADQAPARPARWSEHRGRRAAEQGPAG
jgi:probable O-glycosylation ligase (exosortase A-associated)